MDPSKVSSSSSSPHRIESHVLRRRHRVIDSESSKISATTLTNVDLGIFRSSSSAGDSFDSGFELLLVNGASGRDNIQESSHTPKRISRSTINSIVNSYRPESDRTLPSISTNTDSSSPLFKTISVEDNGSGDAESSSLPILHLNQVFGLCLASSKPLHRQTAGGIPRNKSYPVLQQLPDNTSSDDLRDTVMLSSHDDELDVPYISDLECDDIKQILNQVYLPSDQTLETAARFTIKSELELQPGSPESTQLRPTVEKSCFDMIGKKRCQSRPSIHQAAARSVGKKSHQRDDTASGDSVDLTSQSPQSSETQSPASFHRGEGDKSTSLKSQTQKSQEKTSYRRYPQKEDSTVVDASLISELLADHMKPNSEHIQEGPKEVGVTQTDDIKTVELLEEGNESTTPNICNLEEQRSYPGKELLVRVHVKDLEETLGNKPEMWEHLKNAFSNKLTRDITSDVTVMVGGQAFRAHKIVLASHSQWFRITLRSQAESVIKLPRISSESFSLVYNWMYSLKIPEKPSKIIILLKTAYLLRMGGLIDECLKKARCYGVPIPDCPSKSLPFPSCIREGDEFDISRGRVSRHIQTDRIRLNPEAFRCITTYPEFFDLGVTALCNLLNEDNLDIDSELSVFDAAMAWLAYDWQARIIHVQQVLNCVRFPLMSDRELLSVVYHQKNVIVISLPYLRDLILKAYLYWSAVRSNEICRLPIPLKEPRRRTKLRRLGPGWISRKLGQWEAAVRIQAWWRGFSVRIRLAIENGAATLIQATYRGYLTRRMLLDVGYWADREKEQSRKEEPTKKQEEEEVEEEEEEEEAMDEDTAVLIIQKYYRGYLVRRKLKCLNTAATIIQRHFRGYKSRDFFKQIQLKKHKIEARSTFMLLGGLHPHLKWTSENAGRQCLLYRPENRIWDSVALLPIAIHYPKAVYLDNVVYMSGGCSPSVYEASKKIVAVNHVRCWSPQKREWLELPSLRHCRVHHEMVALKGKLYVIGGQDETGRILESVERFDPIKGKVWEEVAPLVVGRMGAAVTVINDSIVVCGGVANPNLSSFEGVVLRTTELYDPQKDRWLIGPDLRFPVCYASLCHWENKLRLVGGVTYMCRGDVLVAGSISTVDTFNEENEEWQLVNHMENPRHGSVVGLLDDYMFVIGGLSSQSQTALSSVEVYDELLGAWVTDKTPSLPRPMSGMALVHIPFDIAASIPSLDQIQDKTPKAKIPCRPQIPYEYLRCSPYWCA